MAVTPSRARAALVAARLRNQWLAPPPPAADPATEPARIVARLCAVQSQDYTGGKWALGVRSRGLADAAVDAAFDAGAILRTHVMRPTWHFVTPADIRWMLTLTAPRVHAMSASAYRTFGLDAKTVSRAHRVLEAALAGGRFRTRTELAAALSKRGLDAKGIRLGLLLIHAELEQVVCSGPGRVRSGAARGRQLTYALFDERVPARGALTPREPLRELAVRYFTSHGPATLRDFVWWSGLTVAQAKTGVALAGPALESRAIDGFTYLAADWTPARTTSTATFLLPNYDEYLIAYKDRHLLPPEHAPASALVLTGRDAFAHPLVVDGAMVGVWRRTMRGASMRAELVPYLPLTAAQTRAVAAAVARLAAFTGQSM